MSPLGFVHDTVEDHVFGTDTVFRHGEETGIDGHFKDVIVTTVIKTFVVFVWYGLWTIEDQIFDYFKVEFTVSAWISLVSNINMYKFIRKRDRFTTHVPQTSISCFSSRALDFSLVLLLFSASFN